MKASFESCAGDPGNINSTMKLAEISEPNTHSTFSTLDFARDILMKLTYIYATAASTLAISTM